MALIQLGSSLSEKGTSGVRALQDGYAAVPNSFLSGGDDIFRNLPPRPRSPNGLSDVSLAPSQSASQNGVNEKSIPSMTLPSAPVFPPFKLTLPPPHALGNNISDEGHNIPLSSRITEDEEGESSTSEPDNVQVIENTLPGADSKKTANQPSGDTLLGRSSKLSRYNNLLHRNHSSDVGATQTRSNPTELAARANLYRHESLRSASSADAGEARKRPGGLFGALTGLFKGKPRVPRDTTPKKSNPNPSGGEKKDWSTRTDKNVSLVRAGSLDNGSSDDDDRDMSGLVTVTNPAYKTGLTIPSNTPSSTRDTGSGNALRSNSTVAPGPRKLIRTGSTPKVPTQQPIKHKRHASNSAVDVSSLPVSAARTGVVAEAKSATPSRSGTIRSTMSEPPKSASRRTSLPPSIPKFDVRGINGPVVSNLLSSAYPVTN